MNKIIAIIFTLLLSLNLIAQKQSKALPDPNKKIQTVEASCGQCQFKMKGKGCTLAVRINGKPYFVDKAKIDDF